MKHQHRRIKGFDELSQTEIDSMYDLKAKCEEAGKFLNNLHPLNSYHSLTPEQKIQKLSCVEYTTKELKKSFMINIVL